MKSSKYPEMLRDLKVRVVKLERKGTHIDYMNHITVQVISEHFLIPGLKGKKFNFSTKSDEKSITEKLTLEKIETFIKNVVLEKKIYENMIL